MTHITNRRSTLRLVGVPLLLSMALLVASCQSTSDDTATESGTTPSTSDVPTTDPPETVAPNSEPSVTAGGPETTVADTEPPDPPLDLAAIVQPIIDASLEPGAIPWDCCGVDNPATSVRVGVRVEGYDDVVLASGVRLDGTAASPTDSFDVGSLGESAIKQAALALIADGELDPAATVAQWVPGQPNADRVTVQMLIDNTHGWTTAYEEARISLVLADLERSWTLAEALDVTATFPPAAEPGTFDPTGKANTVGALALASVLEQVTGSPIDEVLQEQVAEPLGLDDTLISDGTDVPPDFQWGKFVLPGGTEAVDPRDLSPVAWRTISPDGNAMISTVPDLLDLSSAWATGDYPGGTAPTPDQFIPERVRTSDTGVPVVYWGGAIPFVGYCPCVTVEDGFAPVRTGRQPSTIGSTTFVLNYPADGVQLVLQYNSNDWVEQRDLVEVANEIHDAVVAATSSASGDAPEALQLVGLGDSIPGALGCVDPCESYVELLGPDLARLVGRPVEVSNRATNDSLTSERLLDRVLNNDGVREELANADVIVLSIGINDASDGVFECGLPIGTDCWAGVEAASAENLAAVLAEIATLRDGEPTAIRLTNWYNPYPGLVEENPLFVEFGVAEHELLGGLLCSTAQAAGAMCVDLVPAFNGPTGDAPASAFLLPEPDHVHPNEAGHRLIADLILAGGFPELN